MIFSDSEREHYRKELEAASNAGDLKRVKRLIDNIRLLGDLRENTPIPLTTNPLLEYVKHQSMIKKEKDRKDKPITCDGGLLNFIKNMKLSEDLPTIDLNKIGTPLEDKMWEDVLGFDDIVGFHSPPPYLPKSFRDVLRSGFTEAGWTW